MVDHNRRDFLAGLGAAGLTACAAPVASAQLQAKQGLIWGVNGHPFQAYPGIPFETQLRLIGELGISHYRVGNRNDGLERLYPLAREMGVSLLPVIDPAGSLEETDADALYSGSFEKARAVSTQHRGRFPVWELGNELENFAIIQPCEMRDDGTQYPCEWGPAGGVGPLEYFGARWKKVSAALRGLLDGVAEGDPYARRAIGTAGFGHIGAFDRMLEDGLEWEISVWHDYDGISEEYLKRLSAFGKPIWITEFNAGAWNAKSEEDNARQLTERIEWYRKISGPYRVEAAFVYELFDEPYWGTDAEARMGLYRMEGSEEEGWRAGEAKPAGEAVKAALRP